MFIPLEKKKAEARRRLESLKADQSIVKYFNVDMVLVSEPPLGVMTPLKFYKELSASIAAFEKEHNCLVYHVIRSYTEIGTLDSYLYVSDYQEDWKFERPYFVSNNNYTLACYVNNLSDEYCSEFGSIGIKVTKHNGMIRTE